MKWVLYVIAALVFAGVFVSIVGIVADAEHLTFWTQTLMLSLLGTVIVAPALVYVAAKSPPRDITSSAASEESPPTSAGTSASEAASRPSRSAFRIAAYIFSGLVVVWAAVSLISLFVDQARLSFWTESVMWSLLVLLIWAPVMAFFINPFDDPALQDIPATDTRPAEGARDFVPERATTLSASAGAAEERENETAQNRSSDASPPSAVHHSPETGRDRPDEPNR